MAFRLTNNATISGRLGLLANDKTLFYGLVGYTAQQYKSSHSVSSNYGNGGSFTTSGVAHGLTLGFGAELMVMDNVSVKGEYRYTKLNGLSSSADKVDTTMVTNHDKTTVQQVRLVVSSKW